MGQRTARRSTLYRRRTPRSRGAFAGRLITENTRPEPARPRVRPPLTFSPGESRYSKTGGLRARLEEAAADGEELHVTVDIRELRVRALRGR